MDVNRAGKAKVQYLYGLLETAVTTQTLVIAMDTQIAYIRYLFQASLKLGMSQRITNCICLSIPS